MNEIPFFAVSDCFDIAYRNNSSSSPVKPHIHNGIELYFTLTDLEDVLINDTVSRVESGSLIVIPPYTVHQLFNRKLTVYERYIISVNASWLNQVFSSHPELLHFVNPVTGFRIFHLSDCQQKTLCQHLQSLVPRPETIDPSYYAQFFQLWSELFSMLSSQSDPAVLEISSSQKTINEMISYINAHLTEPFTLEQMASHFYINKDYMARIFKEHTHASIGHYISVRRAGMAQQFLDSGMTVTQVQEKMGFTSYAYFFRFFKKMTGISPSQYRKQ